MTGRKKGKSSNNRKTRRKNAQTKNPASVQQFKVGNEYVPLDEQVETNASQILETQNEENERTNKYLENKRTQDAKAKARANDPAYIASENSLKMKKEAGDKVARKFEKNRALAQEALKVEETAKKAAEAAVKAMQTRVETAIDAMKYSPGFDVVNEINKTKRDAIYNIAYTSNSYYQNFKNELSAQEQTFAKENLHSDHRKIIKEMIQDIHRINNYIYEFTNNNDNGVNYERDQNFAKLNNDGKLNVSMTTSLYDQTFYYNEKNERILVDNVKIFKENAKKLKEAKKEWEKLAKIKNDDDRSYGFAKLSDNIASMTLTSVNTASQGVACVEAFLTYIVCDLVRETIVQGAIGAVEGMEAGYKKANNLVKQAAHNLYRMKHNVDKDLGAAIDNYIKDKVFENKLHQLYSDGELYKEEVEKFNRKDQIDQAKQMLDLLENEANVQPDNFNTLKNVDKDLDAAIDNYINDGKLYNDQLNNFNTLKNAVDKYDEFEKMRNQSSIVTTAIATPSALIAGLVTSVVNSIWQSVRHADLSITQKATLIENRYNTIKPKKGEGWNVSGDETWERRVANEKAETNVNYAIQNNPEAFESGVDFKNTFGRNKTKKDIEIEKGLPASKKLFQDRINERTEARKKTKAQNGLQKGGIGS